MQSRHLMHAAFAAAVVWLSPSVLRAAEVVIEDSKAPVVKPVTPEPIAAPAQGSLPTANPAPSAPVVAPIVGGPIGCGDGCCVSKCHCGFLARLFHWRPHFCCKPHFCHWHCRSHCFHLFHWKKGCSSCGMYASSSDGFGPVVGSYAWHGGVLNSAPISADGPVQYQTVLVYTPLPIAAPRQASTLSLVSRRSERSSESEVARLSETKSPDLLVGTGVSDYFDGKLGSALAHFDAALVKDESNPLAWYGKALAERALGDVAAASSALRQADKLSKELSASQAKLNGLIERLGSDDRAWLRDFRNP